VIFHFGLAFDNHHEIRLRRICDDEFWSANSATAALTCGRERTPNALNRAFLFLYANAVRLLVEAEFPQVIANQVLGYSLVRHASSSSSSSPPRARDFTGIFRASQLSSSDFLQDGAA
jgi:hypothetical protein